MIVAWHNRQDGIHYAMKQNSAGAENMIGPIPREELERAMMKDFEQRCIDSMTPDRGYSFPMDNTAAVIVRYWPNSDKTIT